MYQLTPEMFAQSVLDSLEIINPFQNQERFRKALENDFSILGNKNQIKVNYLQSIIKENQNNPNKTIRAYVQIGDVYFRAGIYTKSLSNYFVALKIAENFNDSITSAFVSLKISRAYYFSDMIPPAYFRPDAYKVLRSAKDSNYIAYSYFYESLNSEQPSVKKALSLKAVAIQKEIVAKNPNDTTALESLSAFLNAAEFTDEAISYAEKAGNYWLVVLYLNNRGYAKVQAGKYNEALLDFQQSLQYCKQGQFKTLLRNTYDNLSRVYRLMGNWEMATSYLQRMHYVQNSLFREEFALQASENKIKFETEKKEIENAILKQQQYDLTSSIASEKWQKFLLFLSFCGASFTAFVIYINRKKIKSINRLLDEKNLQLTHLYNELKESNLNLKNAQETAQLANWEFDAGTNAYTFSEQLPRIFKVKASTLKENFVDSILERVHPDDRGIVEQILKQSNYGLNLFEQNFRTIIDDQVQWIKAKFISDELDGTTMKIRGTMQNITDLKREEETKLKIAAQMSFTKQLLESQEAERKRIAGELHDSLGQDILLIKNRAQIGMQNEDIDSATLEQFSQINKETAQLLTIIREISFNLRPAHLENLGLTETISTVIRKANTTTATDISSTLDNIDNLLPYEDELHVFRIIQEALNNVIKHSKAQFASVEIVKEADNIVITVIDDGNGFVFSGGMGNTSGFGLSSMQNRVTILKGQFSVHSELQKGTKIEITIPI